MSAIAGLLLSLVVPPSGAVDQDRLVSATVRGALAPKAIADLSKQIGIPLAAMPSVKNDVLVIRVKDVKLKDLLDRIAKVIHAGWEPEGEGFRLIRTDAMRQKERADDIVYETELYRKALNEKKKALAEMGELDEKKAEYLTTRLKSIHDRMNPEGGMNTDWRSTQAISDQSPANRAMMRICAAFTPEELAKLPPEHRVVYSTNPTRMQARMPVNLNSILTQFKREVALMSAANKKIFTQQDMNWMFGDQSLYGRGGDGTPTKVLLTVNKFTNAGGIRLQLQVANEKGQVIGSGYGNLTRDWSAQQKVMADVLKQGEKEEPMKLPPAAEAFQKAFALSMQGKPNPEGLPEDLRQQLLKPEENDPLSFAATDILFEVGRIKDLNIVASPTDQFMAGLAFSAQNAKPGLALYLLTQPEMGGRFEDGWFTVEPAMQSVVRERRVDRPSLGICLRACLKKGKLGLDDAAAYALKNKWEESSWIMQGMLGVVGGKPVNRSQGWNWDALRLYGLLTPTQRRYFDSKQPMALRNLTPDQQAIVHKMVFDTPYVNLNTTMEYETAPTSHSEETVDFYMGLGREPTESMPGGVPYDGTLLITFQTDSVVFLGNVDGNQSWMTGRAFTPNELAWEVFQRQRKDIFPWLSESNMGTLPLDNLRAGERMLVDFHFKFTKNIGLDTQLQESTYGSGAPFSVNNMPAAYKKAFDDAMAQHVEQYKDVKPGDLLRGSGGVRQTVPPR